MILHEMLRHESLAKTLLYSERLYDFIPYIDKTTFGIACDAMANFKELLTRHKAMVADFLDKNYDEVGFPVPRIHCRLLILGASSSKSMHNWSHRTTM